MHNKFLHHDLGTDNSKWPDRGTLSVYTYLRESLVLTFLLLALLAQTSVMATEVSFSGFMSIVGGKVLSGSRTNTFDNVKCPCFVADWTHLGVYNSDTSFSQESRAGVRMNAKVNESLTGVIQVDGRSVTSKGTLEWAYVAYTPAEDWMVQVGRKRLPIYYYSDFLDVGFAYPWVRPPPDVYGWEVDNFNGITLAKTGHWGDWNSRVSLFIGEEESKANTMSTHFYPGVAPPDLTWRDIHGADVEFTRDWFSMRLVYIESKVDLVSTSGWLIAPDPGQTDPVLPNMVGGQQRIYGVSVNIDYENWFVRSELSLFDRWRDFGYVSKAAMAGFGYHIRDYTPMLTYVRYEDDNPYGDPNWESYHLAFSLRYDINSTSAIKVQLDEYRELSLPDTTSGSANLLSVSFDRVF